VSQGRARMQMRSKGCMLVPDVSTSHCSRRTLQLEQDISPGRKSPPHPRWDFPCYADGSGVM